ncbi:ATP-binding cassette sub-family F like protein [Guillardia theta CCMP2712]|uniref:ATP-binding cassette sub-family F like protein n=1 Tax=Guillardia theta (strain CCMP2712) TaxID=905079 RepID=L1K0X3_GUITC|nr:ATP-binding cassette sub-family F like protein [Guillardia theta CCMP2712]EKX54018.1 ATP-binding cassette sub-family F like protein [Guillardia theta CCMP2712]|eukprot:XP_005840998.1 ATP-binding cassette sub-family F like protein [Guillardia theta CCMP2712]
MQLENFALTQRGSSVEGGTESMSKDISVSGFSISVGGKILLEDAELLISAGNRYGLVGPNGQGKSTLLMHIAKKAIAIPRHIDILMVEQEISASSKTPLQLVLEADVQRDVLLRERDQLEKQLARSFDMKKQERLQEVYSNLNAMRADAAESAARRILLGLGFPMAWHERPSSSFSGGWRMRISLARALFIRPTLLLLDEPTNHLDLNAVLWLDDYLRGWEKTLIVVSHDVEFLNSVCTHTIHLHERKLYYYRGGYDSFRSQFEAKQTERTRAWEKQQKTLRALKASGKSRAQAAETLAKKGGKGAEKSKKGGKGGKEEEQKQPVILSKPKEYEVRFHLPEPPELSPPYLQLCDVSFSYEQGPHVLTNVNLGLWPDSRVAIVGANGCGKSTLLRLMLGELTPSKGEVRQNPKLRVGRYSQHFVDVLPLEQTAVEHLQALAASHGNSMLEGVQKCRQQLGRYGLESRAHVIGLKHLSGGQKARVVLASLAASVPHVLLLDEPTNHLDIESIEALGDALLDFKGAVVLVSHDARLIRRAISSSSKGEIWVVGDGKVTPFLGDMDDYQQLVLTQMEKMMEGCDTR